MTLNTYTEMVFLHIRKWEKVCTVMIEVNSNIGKASVVFICDLRFDSNL